MGESLSRKGNFVRRCPPTFVGIGSLRCGSTWLYQVLKCHPDIRLSDRKEMNFFFMREMLHHDLDWYEAHFEAEDGLGPRPIRGEISPIYGRLKAWQVNRIAKLLPDLRIILTLRHPIERAWSQVLLELGSWEVEMSEKLVQLTFCARSSVLVTGYLRITVALYRSGLIPLDVMQFMSISSIDFAMTRKATSTTSFDISVLRPRGLSRRNS